MMQDLREVLNDMIDETEVDIQAVKTFLDTRTKSLQGTIAETENDLHEELASCCRSVHRQRS
jgi:hypothetical protein